MSYGAGCPDCGGELRLELEPVKEEEGTVKTMEMVLVCGWCNGKFECPK